MNPKKAAILVIGITTLILLSINNETVLAGKKVTVQYNASSGEIKFNQSIITFTAGNNEVIKGLDAAVIGMRRGETKNINLPAIMAFGEYDNNEIYGLQASELISNGITSFAIGDEIILNDKNSVIIGVDNESNIVIIDSNHEFAGLDFNLTVKVLSIT